MEEEAEKSRDARLEAWGREDYSVYKPKKVQQTTETVEMEVLFIFDDVYAVTHSKVLRIMAD